MGRLFTVISVAYLLAVSLVTFGIVRVWQFVWQAAPPPSPALWQAIVSSSLTVFWTLASFLLMVLATALFRKLKLTTSAECIGYFILCIFLMVLAGGLVYQHSRLSEETVVGLKNYFATWFLVAGSSGAVILVTFLVTVIFVALQPPGKRTTNSKKRR